jgi:hypothetical protein
LRVFEIKMQRKVFRPRMEEERGSVEKSIMKTFTTCKFKKKKKKKKRSL